MLQGIGVLGEYGLVCVRACACVCLFVCARNYVRVRVFKFNSQSFKM
jgi:hypothetical protein